MTAGKHIFLDLLRSEGVQFVFGNPGTTELPLMDAFVVESGIRYILGLNEIVVLGMADGYAQATGRLGVVNLHAAPGLGNAMGMLYNAKKAGAPLLVTAGQQDTSFALTEPLLWDDLATMARPLVKWSHEVGRLADLPRAVRRAAKVALTAPTGPVFLSIPGDVLTDALEVGADLDLMTPTRIGPRLVADAAAIEAAADLIAASATPVIFAGDAVAKSDAHAELAALAEAIGAPVYLEGMANTAAFPSNHPLYAGSVSRMAPALRAVMEGHDLLVSIGADLLTQSQISGVEALAPGTKLVHLDNDPWEIGKNHPATAALLGDPKATLPLLTQAVLAKMARHQSKTKTISVANDGAITLDAEPLSMPELDARLRAANAASPELPIVAATARRAAVEAGIAAKQAALVARAEAEAATMPLSPLAVCHLLGTLIPDDAIVVEELLSSGMNTVRQLIPATRPDSWFGMRGGGIGVCLPQAAGIALGKPGRPVVALSGDGSAMYSLAALWTLAHYRLPVVAVIFNNRSYRILKQRTRAIGGHSADTETYVAMDLDDPPLDFLKLSEGHGVAAVRVETLDALREAFLRGLAGEAPLLIEVVVDRQV